MIHMVLIFLLNLITKDKIHPLLIHLITYLHFLKEMILDKRNQYSPRHPFLTKERMKLNPYEE